MRNQYECPECDLSVSQERNDTWCSNKGDKLEYKPCLIHTPWPERRPIFESLYTNADIKVNDEDEDSDSDDDDSDDGDGMYCIAFLFIFDLFAIYKKINKSGD